MTTTISINEAQANLPEIIRKLMPGEEVVITDNNRPVARLTPAPGSPSIRNLGTLQGTVMHVTPDFDAPLDDFKEYME